MLQATIRIDEREYFLPAEHDREAIMRMISSQVRAGGGFVEIVRTPDRAVNVLVAPGTNVCIEVRRVDDESEAPEGELEAPWWRQSWEGPFDLL